MKYEADLSPRVNSKTLPNLDPLANHCPTSTRGQLSFRYRHAITRPSSQSGQAVESLRPAFCQVRHWAEKRGGLGAKNVQISLGLAIFQRFPLNLADAFSKGGA